jgi:hypothetical protein
VTPTGKNPRFTGTFPTPLRKCGRSSLPDTALLGELEQLVTAAAMTASALASFNAPWPLLRGIGLCFSPCFIMVYLFDPMAGVDGDIRTLPELLPSYGPQ